MQVSSRHVLRPGRLPFLPFRCCAFAPCPERTPCQERSLYLPADCSRLRQSWQDLSRPACIPWADPQPGPVVFRLCEPPSVQTDVCRLFDLRRCVVYKNSNDNDYNHGSNTIEDDDDINDTIAMTPTNTSLPN